jgi:mannose-6-phosphate isomerase-like protein (cupin superfamily)
MADRRDFLKLIPLAPAFPLFASGGNQLPSIVVDAQNAKLIREPFGDQRVFFEGPTGQIKSMTAGSLLLKPGMSPHPPHRHEEEEFMILTEGTGEIVIDGRKSPVGAGSMMYCESNVLHGIVNTGQVPLLFYYYKWKA